MDTNEFHVLREWSGKTIQEVLSAALSISKGNAKKLLDAKKVFINNNRIWIAKHVVKTGDLVSIAAYSGSAGKPLLEDKAVIFKDRYLLSVNKPYGILSNGAKSMEDLLRKKFDDERIRAVHRLDKDTSGVILYSRTAEAWDAMYALFEKRQVEKIYHVICVGALKERERIIRTPIDGKEAVSSVRLLKQLGEACLLEVSIETGRTHQIRKHMLSIGLPVLGDAEYASKRSAQRRFRTVGRQMLHAREVRFAHPFSGKRVVISAAYPADFDKLIRERI